MIKEQVSTHKIKSDRRSVTTDRLKLRQSTPGQRSSCRPREKNRSPTSARSRIVIHTTIRSPRNSRFDDNKNIIDRNYKLNSVRTKIKLLRTL